jgi:hypothetical protein
MLDILPGIGRFDPVDRAENFMIPMLPQLPIDRAEASDQA